MTPTVDNNDTVLRLVRTFRAPRERVFEAWTNPEHISRWMGCSQTRAAEAEVDPRVGGRLRVTMESENGPATFECVYTVFAPPEKLAFTWKWLGDDDFGKLPETRVTVDLVDLGDGRTELHLTHEGFPSAEIRDLHDGGWGASLDKLAGVVEAS